MSPTQDTLGPVLLIGGGGMLGRAWRKLLQTRELHCHAPTPSELDITNPDHIARVITDKHKLVINCAAWTDVDAAETHTQDANRVNATAVGQLAQRCKQVGAKLIHYSTDYVFDGQGTSPYTTDHPTAPVNAYGQSKLNGERLTQESGCDHLLIRTSWLYAPWGKNFVLTIASLATQRDSLRVVSDQHGRPTSVEHLADATLKLIQQNRAGTCHVTDGGQCSWYDLARQVAKRVNPNCRVEPCTTEEFPRPAKRPAYSVLDISQTEKWLGPMPDWKQNLADALSRATPQASGAKT